MRKLATFSLLFLLLVAVVFAVSLRFFPSVYVVAFNEFSEEQLTVEKLDVSFFPLTVNIQHLSYDDVNQRTIANVKDAKLQSQPFDWLRGRNNYWNLELNDAVVKLHLMPQPSEDNNSDVEEVVETLNVHRVLSSLSMVLRSIIVELDEHSSISVENVSTHLNDETLVDFTQVEQDINFSMEYLATSSSTPLLVEGLLKSRMVNGVSALTLALAELDLDPVFDDANTLQEPNIKAAETEMDWSWLSTFDPFKLDLNIAELVWAKSSANKIEVVLELDDKISLYASSQVAWSVSDDVNFNDSIELKGEWNPISAISMGADLRGNFEISTPVLSAKLAGDINANGSSGNKVSLELSSKSMPLTTNLDSNTLALVDQYFPIDVSLELEQLESTTAVDVLSAQFGESDVNGSVAFNEESDGLLSIESNFNSKKIIHKTLEENDDSESTSADTPDSDAALSVAQSESEVPTSEAESRLFSDETIDWTWLDGISASFTWRAEKVIFDDIEITALELPIKLHDGELDFKLDVGNLANGTLKFDSLLKKVDEQAELSMNLAASDVVLEKLNLLPPEELRKGITDLQLSLISKGSTSQDLASSLSGTIKMNIGAGIVGNNSFELIGSDLILGMLNKLNPFSKSDKTTDLECAVANLKVENGKIEVDKSLALKTSKLTIVADGYIDLASDKIKLDITPKARSGVGVDASSLVKFVALGGSVMQPKPVVTASGAIKSAAIVGAAVSTGGVSLLATNAAEKTLVNVDVCERADKAFSQTDN